MNTKNLSSLQIHQLSEAQYKRIIENGQYDETALYLTPDTGDIYIINIQRSPTTEQYYIPNFNWTEIRTAIEQNKTIICQEIYEDDEGVLSRLIYLPLDIDASYNALYFYYFELDTGLFHYLSIAADGTVDDEIYSYALTSYVDNEIEVNKPYVIEVYEYDQIDFDEIREQVTQKINNNIPVLLREHSDNITNYSYVLTYSDFTSDTHQIESCKFSRLIQDSDCVDTHFIEIDFQTKTIAHYLNSLTSSNYVETAIEEAKAEMATATDEKIEQALEDSVEQKLAALVDSAPETLNTLNELANALGDDPNFATTVANQIGTLESKIEELEANPGAGESTESGGSIFGDAETNEATGSNAVVMGESSQALGDNSLAIGKEVQTGCKGYYIKAIEPAKRYIYLATDGVECIPIWLVSAPGDIPVDYEPSFNTGYQVSDLKANPDLPSYQNEFSISSEDYYHWVFAGNIKAISGNRITYDTPNILSDNPDKEHAAYKKWMENFEGKAKPMKFYVPTQSYAGNIVTGHYTLAVGKGSVAADDYAVAEGRYNLAVGYAAHVEGDSNRAGYTSHAEGVRTQALGLGAHTEGQETVATGRFAHAQGSGSSATGDYGHAEGFYTQATGTSSHAQGSGSIASGAGSHASGANTVASGHHSFAGGLESVASGNRSFAFGNATGAFASYGAALGYKTQVGYADVTTDTDSFVGRSVKLEKMSFEAQGMHVRYVIIPSHATQVTMTLSNVYDDVEPEGSGQITGVFRDIAFYDSNDQFVEYLIEGTNSIPEGDVKWIRVDGYVTTAGSPGYAASFADVQFDFNIPDNLGSSSLAFGSYTAALGNHSLAGGLYATASGSRALAFGEGSSDNRTEATGDVSIALGSGTKSAGAYSIALGKNTEATASHTLTNGINTKATQSHAIALGSNSNAKGIASLAFGDTNNAEKAYTWALGQRNTVNAIHSLAIGRDNTTNGRFNFAFGEGNTTNGDYAVAIGANATANEKTTVIKNDKIRLIGNDIQIKDMSLNAQGLTVDTEQIRLNSWHTLDLFGHNISIGEEIFHDEESTPTISDFISLKANNLEMPGFSALAAYTHEENGEGWLVPSTVTIGEGYDLVKMYGGGNGIIIDSPYLEINNGEFGVNINVPHITIHGNTLTFGEDSQAQGQCSLAFGTSAEAIADHSLAFGDGATALGAYSLAFGSNATTSNEGNIAIGINAKASSDDTIALGNGAKATVSGAIGIGANAIANSPYTIAIGHGSNANKSYSVAIGYGNTASAAGAFALGYSTTAGGKYSATFGQNTSTAAEGAIAFGNTSKANVTSNSGAYNSLVGGYYSESSHNATIVVGNQLRSANINGAVFGQYNSIEGLGTTANDRALLILGNGSSDAARSNAFVVLRDGRMILGSGSYGTTLPDSGYEGQIFFLES